MIVVIQCAKKKRDGAGFLLTDEGRRVSFVADPRAPSDGRYHYARPDDLSDRGVTWREVLLEYNRNPRNNPLGLYPAYQLYERGIYGELVERYGVEKTYILSAGWGLIRADFLTPCYDITFTQNAERHKRRRKRDPYDDFKMLPDETDEAVAFFGGKDYVPLFCDLTAPIKACRTVFYSSMRPPRAPGCTLQLFNTNTRTNWHYECRFSFSSSRQAATGKRLKRP